MIGKKYELDFNINVNVNANCGKNNDNENTNTQPQPPQPTQPNENKKEFYLCLKYWKREEDIQKIIVFNQDTKEVKINLEDPNRFMDKYLEGIFVNTFIKEIKLLTTGFYPFTKQAKIGDYTVEEYYTMPLNDNSFVLLPKGRLLPEGREEEQMSLEIETTDGQIIKIQATFI